MARVAFRAREGERALMRDIAVWDRARDSRIDSSGWLSNSRLQDAAQKQYFAPLYSLVYLAVFLGMIILQTGSTAVAVGAILAHLVS
jgi:hypothetical protein